MRLRHRSEMAKMIRLAHTVHIPAPPQRVFGYLSDFSDLTEWDPSVRQARKVSCGVISEGTRFEVQLAAGFSRVSMTYRITRYAPPDDIELIGVGASFHAVDRIRFSSEASGTRVDYEVEVHFDRPVSRFTSKVMFVWLNRNARQAFKRLVCAFHPPVRLPFIHARTRLADATILPGLIGFTRLGYHRQRKRWRPLSTDLTGRTVVVTGATSGIGKAAAGRLARMGARVIMVARNPEAARQVGSEIREQTGNSSVFWEVADLSRMGQVRDLANRLSERAGGIHALINNAGALFRRQTFTPEGHDASLATNLMGPFLLTNLLIPALKSHHPSRVITVSSGGMYLQRFDPELLDGHLKSYSGVQAYALAKRAQIILTAGWAEMLRPKGVTAHAMHPGWVDTPGIAESLPGFRKLARHVLRSPEQGADTVVWLAAADEAVRTTGGFWLDRALHPVHVVPGTRESDSDRKWLWDYLCEKTGWRAADLSNGPGSASGAPEN